MSLASYESIFEQFSATSAEEWKNKIIKDLKGDKFDKLIWHSKEDIEVLPFYTKEDNQKYRLNIPEKQTYNWLITERIIVDEISSANRKALFSLQCGANAIVFDLLNKSFTTEEIELLTKDILVDIAPITFENYSSESKNILEKLVKNSCTETIKIPQSNSIVDELVYALNEANNTNEFPRQFPACRQTWHFFITQNYFFEIAKLRAFRWLFKQVCDLQSKPFSVFVQCETGLQKRNEADEYTNMLRNTTEAMSAILGGCDSLIINSHDIANDHTDFGKRIARNINHILQHESYFSEIKDAAKGSYYIEYLTHQLAKKAWEKFSLSNPK